MGIADKGGRVRDRARARGARGRQVRYEPKVADALDPSRRRLPASSTSTPTATAAATRARRGRGVQVSDGVQIARDRLPTGGYSLDARHRAPHHRHRVHHAAGGLQAADRRVHDAALLQGLGQVADGAARHRRLRAPPRDPKATATRSPSPTSPIRTVNPDPPRADRADQLDGAEPGLHPGQRRPHQQRHRRRVLSPTERHGRLAPAGLAGGRQPRVLRRRPADLRRRGSTTTAATSVPSGTRSTTATATSSSSRTAAVRRSTSSATGSSTTSRPHADRQARVVLHAYADERPVRLAFASTTTTPSRSSGTRPSSRWSATSTPTTSTTRVGPGRQAHPDQLELVHDRPLPARLPLRAHARDRFDNPFRMYGVERALGVSFRRRAPAVAAALDEVQVNAYHTSDEGRRGVRYRVDGGGSWRSRTVRRLHLVRRRCRRRRRRSGKHRIEVEAVDESGGALERDVGLPRGRGRRAKIGAGRGLAAVPRRRSGTAASRRTLLAPGPRSWPGCTARAGVFLTGSPVDRRRRRVRRHARRERRPTSARARARPRRRRALWEFDTAASVHGSPRRRDGLVYVPTLHGTLYALDAPAPASCAGSAEPERPEPPRQPALVLLLLAGRADGTVYWPLPDARWQGEPRPADGARRRAPARRSGSRR